MEIIAISVACLLVVRWGKSILDVASKVITETLSA